MSYEPLNDDGTYKQNIWQQVIGDDYIEEALRIAREADPAARLYINEYSTEWIWPKSNALFSIAQDFTTRGVPLDGIGFQIHSDTRWPVPYADLVANMTRFGALGLRTDITEMDVGTSHYAGTTAQKFEAQRIIYSDAARACQDSPTCWAFTTWGFTDNYTWLGTPELPLPFDTGYQAKPAWAAITSQLVPSVGGVAEKPALSQPDSAGNPGERAVATRFGLIAGALTVLGGAGAWLVLRHRRHGRAHAG
jgi:endo-1,4-beta-xylanase